MNIKGLNHITIAVSNIDISFEFYSNILKFKPIMKSEFSAYFDINGIWIALVIDDNAGSSNHSHIAFTVEEDTFIEIKKELQENGVIEWQKNVTEGDSYYFLDPSGNKLEIHVGNMFDRIKHGKMYWENNVKWYI